MATSIGTNTNAPAVNANPTDPEGIATPETACTIVARPRATAAKAAAIGAANAKETAAARTIATKLKIRNRRAFFWAASTFSVVFANSSIFAAYSSTASATSLADDATCSAARSAAARPSPRHATEFNENPTSCATPVKLSPSARHFAAIACNFAGSGTIVALKP
ncbi:hypothetical protein, partial [Rhizomonospora bruguierae]|uniref:hypothetical protein n=1 Tax=Rhizomonospora bruguierae TaxID=1581705 RepID=UPI001BCAA7BD